MQVVGTYRDRDAVRAYAEKCSRSRPSVRHVDFLGAVTTELEALATRLRQFFTPYNVSRMIARRRFRTSRNRSPPRASSTLAKPASRSGGMVPAAAETIERQGFNPGLHMLVRATDLSPLCFHTTYIQLSLCGVAALVIHGN